MNQSKKENFPGGSKSKVNQAGNNIRIDSASFAEYQIVEEWRAAHRGVLNTFQAILRNRTKKQNIIVAQRHKRKSTIFGKLHRFPRMQLARMDDVAGCRLIFNDVKKLYRFREVFHKARFKHKRRNDIDKYDYIKSPKNTGYRGIHDVYNYDVNSEVGRHLKGLMVEVQYRTQIQHAWATAVEVIGFITESQPKFEEGDKRYQYAMALASEILARAFEKSYGPFPDLEDTQLVENFLKIDNELNMLKTLRGLNATETLSTSKRNNILIFSESGDLEVKSYENAPEALRSLFELEKEFPNKDIVLVKADRSEDVRFAFKNYFSDAKDFIQLIESGCQDLLRSNVIDEKKLIDILKTK